MNRSICIPGVPPVDISQLERLIDSEPFQALRQRKQLGINYLIFPGAVHTRFEHAIGVLSPAQRLCTIHHIPAEEARHLEAFALLHDIGHGPFSHQTEPVLAPGNHHQRGVQLIRELSSELAAIGVDAQRIIDMMTETAPEGKWVSDRNLGVDKLDYLNRDALHIGFMGVPDIERLQYYTHLTDKGLAIEEKYIEDGKRLQKFYSYLHQHGYLNKTALAAQRMLQRACQEQLSGKTPAASDAIWRMDDAQLVDFLSRESVPLAAELMSQLKTRRLYKSFLVLKVSGYSYVEHEGEKELVVKEYPRSVLKTICGKLSDIEEIRRLEETLCCSCSLPPGSILFAAMPYFKKLVPRDLRVIASGGRPDYWLFDKDGDHRASLESDYLRTFAVRLICPPQYRGQLSKKSDELARLLLADPID